MSLYNTAAGMLALFATGFIIGYPMSIKNATIVNKIVCYSIGVINLYNGIYNLFII